MTSVVGNNFILFHTSTKPVLSEAEGLSMTGVGKTEFNIIIENNKIKSLINLRFFLRAT